MYRRLKNPEYYDGILIKVSSDFKDNCLQILQCAGSIKLKYENPLISPHGICFKNRF